MNCPSYPRTRVSQPHRHTRERGYPLSSLEQSKMDTR